MGGTEEDEKLAYIAGLLHDIVRPNYKKTDHALLSAEKSRIILSKFFDEETKEKIILPIKDHSEATMWISPLHQSVFLADKILEQMGAYIVFRRCMYVGESKDYSSMKFEDAIGKQFGKKLQKYDSNSFSEKFKKLVKYQYSFPTSFFNSFERNEDWSRELGLLFYKNGKEGKPFENAIRNFTPSYKKCIAFKQEAVEYMNGNKFNEFEKLILW